MLVAGRRCRAVERRVAARSCRGRVRGPRDGRWRQAAPPGAAQVRGGRVPRRRSSADGGVPSPSQRPANLRADDDACDVGLPTVTHTHTHTHTHQVSGDFSGTTRVSRYQKGKTNLDFTEARDSEWQWHQLGHMQVCTSFQTDNHVSTSPLSCLQAGRPSCRPTKSVKALKVDLATAINDSQSRTK